MEAILYGTCHLESPRASLNPGGRDGPFAVVWLGRTAEMTTHDPADFDAVAAEFTRAAAMLREALAGKDAPRG